MHTKEVTPLRFYSPRERGESSCWWNLEMVEPWSPGLLSYIKPMSGQSRRLINIKCLNGKGAAPAGGLGLPHCACFPSFVTTWPTWFRVRSQARSNSKSARDASCWSKLPANLNPLHLGLINNVASLKWIQKFICGFVIVVAPVTLHEEREFSASLHSCWLGILQFERRPLKRAVFGKFTIDEGSKWQSLKCRVMSSLYCAW